MNESTNIDINESIRTQTVVKYSDSLNRLSKFDYGFNSFIYLIVGILLSTLGFNTLKYLDLPDIIFGVIFIICGLISFFGTYRSYNYNKLDTVNHDLTKGRMKDILIKYFKESEVSIAEENKDIIFIQKQSGHLLRIYTFINIDRTLYYNIVNITNKLSGPTPLGHLFFKIEIEKLIKEFKQNSTP